MDETLTVTPHEPVYLTPASRTTCRESLAKVALALANYYTAPPISRELPHGLLCELTKVSELT